MTSPMAGHAIPAIRSASNRIDPFTFESTLCDDPAGKRLQSLDS
jgi:hypothetical protein